MPLMTRPARIESTSSRPRRPAYQAASPAQKLSESASSPDDYLDPVGERDIGEMENEQDGQRWDGEQEEPQLEARRDEPLFHRRTSAERCPLDKSVREDVVVQIATTGPTIAKTTSSGFKAAQPS